MQIDRRTLLWLIIGIMFLMVIFLTYKTISLETTSQVVSATKTAALSSSGGMVGGC